MKTFKLYFQNIDSEKTFCQNKIDIAEFNDIEELKKNYLNYFEEDYPATDWEIMDFDERIKGINKNEGIILAVNNLAVNLLQFKSMENTENNPILDILKSAPILPSLLCVEYN
ncbi:hypothetical protein [Flavobacterium collinsii]|uniref:Barstar (barnase inhibitor) domain-containing protein n=1 Tax=Flavobacterium collinsii TaxID=1114861 RepID=A0ABN7EPT7_9FLAO|nr:hypothetical protein [Flavobacterium collinsii]CAA9202235.1 hypothetical protein FLACOL7796_04167 [Flavobacterium collinsii]